jgi:hypothetical protein
MTSPKNNFLKERTMKKRSFICVAVAALMTATPALAAEGYAGTGSVSAQTTVRAQADAREVDTAANAEIDSSAEAGDVTAPDAGMAMDADTGLPDTDMDMKKQTKIKAKSHERTASARVKAKTDAQAKDDEDGSGLSLQGKVNTQMPALNATAGGGLDAPVGR